MPKKPITARIITIRLNELEMASMDAELVELKKRSGLDVKIGQYAKHAVMEHARLRRIEVAVQSLSKHHRIAGGELTKALEAVK